MRFGLSFGGEVTGTAVNTYQAPGVKSAEVPVSGLLGSTGKKVVESSSV
jgi:hypothetical protein